MGQRFGRTVKAVAPDWLIAEVKRDVHFVRRKFNIARDVALIDFQMFKDCVADMNSIMRTCCIEDDQQVLFGVRTVEDDERFWKSHVRIICLKIDKNEGSLTLMRCMNLPQFWSLRDCILRELQKKNALQEISEDYVLVHGVNQEDDIVSSAEEVVEEQLPSSSLQEHPLTISTVLHRVDEYGELETTECLICLDNQIDVSLPCAHSFCSSCINKWVKESNSCPTCRDEIESPEDLWEFTEIPNITQINRQLVDLATGEGT